VRCRIWEFDVRVFTASLAFGVSITLGYSDDGWRFLSWSEASGHALGPPSATARAQRFSAIDDALRFFRAEYPPGQPPT
jgi:hypothetical protein